MQFSLAEHITLVYDKPLCTVEVEEWALEYERKELKSRLCLLLAMYLYASYFYFSEPPLSHV